MPVSVEWGKVREVLGLIEDGKLSYATAGKRLGVGKATVYRWHLKKLEGELGEAGEKLKALKQKEEELRRDFEGLEGKYRERREALEGDYEKRRSALEEEIETLKKEAEAIESSFKARGLSLKEGIKLLGEAASLRDEQEALKAEISKRKAEVLSWEGKAKQTRLSLLQLEKEREGLREAVSSLGSTYYSYMDWLQTEAPRMERYKAQLEGSVRNLEVRKAELEKEVSCAQDIVGKLEMEADQKWNAINELEERRKVVTATLEAEKAKIKEETEELVRRARELANRMIKDAEKRGVEILRGAEEEKTRILGEIGELKAERELILTAVRTGLKKVKSEAEREDVTPLDKLLIRLPRLSPLPEEEDEAGA